MISARLPKMESAPAGQDGRHGLEVLAIATQGPANTNFQQPALMFAVKSSDAVSRLRLSPN
jgi:hypothetical protein